MGHTQTQFVPPYPSMGRENRYQPQSATQAPVISQIGQRVQGMGRGRTQGSYGSQAGTSMTQGRAYAMVPQVGLTDQSDVQGTFLLLHFLIGVLFNLDASYSYLSLHHV